MVSRDLDAVAAAKAVAAVVAEAERHGWRVAAAVVDAGGHLLHFARMDGAPASTVDVSIAKARSAALFQVPTKTFAEGVSQGNVSLLALPNAIPLDGGVPVLLEDRVAGAIGVSGATAAQDGAAAAAGLGAVSAQGRAIPVTRP